ncbi:polysaccharide biosynthesis/export family protein [Elizabethkingia meningoseptica]|uniref:polysaccharide biosynthesis/export family protein n=1 Tax=Elizabethkingia meningoseptica TaxID=238 RepID=UPI0023B18F7E|nr:polysaccharide biosynthesis/export family protein [Elizabethkingia meningoseptica]MDE5438570.1 polysaccharide biosynthesis/export family protein [Elizabethkingia meningoseptica]MDE5507641.1 polysaccharide biosynthesis/export family protein [Elizabethkingia meningoseptica]MDE5516509.1 polysaccharide biosynthesis/export family protein [Elizabethkingia meningoseptica]MDE5526754.1 polysaccharide biosynthesis/export family protein [Elizabethkingia meningoseptica]MDE5530760.1 polysaccharide biosy
MKIRSILLLLVATLAIISCRTRNDINYLQDVDKAATETAIRMENNTLQPGDQLVINIMAKDLDVVKPFNQNYSSGQILQNPQLSGNISPTIPTASGPTYIIDQNGEIDFPVLGKLETRGLAVEQFKNNLYNKITRYIKEPTVSVKLNNFRVSVMGEVVRPGEYVIADGQTNFMKALALAGDLTMYGIRDNILLVRTVDGKMEKVRIDITRSDFMDSPYYNLKQGDVIYVSANKTKEKTSRLDPNMPIYISVASIVVTILALVFKK